jgi:hypothetical protein
LRHVLGVGGADDTRSYPVHDFPVPVDEHAELSCVAGQGSFDGLAVWIHEARRHGDRRDRRTSHGAVTTNLGLETPGGSYVQAGSPRDDRPVNLPT